MTGPRDCTYCGERLTFNWLKRVWEGKHHADCPVLTSKQSPLPTANPTHTLEAVIGPSGAQLWEVTVSLHRASAEAQGYSYTEVVEVRAASYDGAILLTREMFPEKMIDAEAVKISDTDTP